MPLVKKPIEEVKEVFDICFFLLTSTAFLLVAPIKASVFVFCLHHFFSFTQLFYLDIPWANPTNQSSQVV
jgi:hypothetical protein